MCVLSWSNERLNERRLRRVGRGGGMTTSEGSERGVVWRDSDTQYFFRVTTQKHAAVRRG